MNITSDRGPQLAVKRIQLSEADVERILELYRPEHQYVAQACLERLRLTCVLKPTVYPYTQRDVFPYITAPTATIYSCQLAYVLVGGLALKAPTLAASLGGGDWSQFLIQRDQAWLRFGTFNTRFSAAVENRGLIPANIRIVRTRHVGVNVHCVMEFEIGRGITGNIHGVIMGKQE
jgi:hypothetical protein